MARRAGWRVAALLSLLALTACGPPLRAQYADYTRALQARGLMRTDRAPQDAAVTDAVLAGNFLRIALAVEDFGDQAAATKPLNRWEEPITASFYIPKPSDRPAVFDMLERLSTLTSVPVGYGTLGDEDGPKPNLLIAIVTEAEKRQLAAQVSSLKPSGSAITPEWLAKVIATPVDVSPCHATVFFNDKGAIVYGLVLILAETADLFRQTCIEEELAQVMGLTNDDPSVRPSIFNDDQEFALLTEHNKFLLQMLYHPLLKPGMTEAEVAPLLPRVIADIRRTLPKAAPAAERFSTPAPPSRPGDAPAARQGRVRPAPP